jgi:hypothetical protein
LRDQLRAIIRSSEHVVGAGGVLDAASIAEVVGQMSQFIANALNQPGTVTWIAREQAQVVAGPPSTVLVIDTSAFGGDIPQISGSGLSVSGSTATVATSYVDEIGSAVTLQ